MNTINLDIPVHTARASAKQTVLLDSGATENFISARTWEQLGIGRQELGVPITVHNVDGTENKRGKIRHYCWLRVLYDGKQKLQKFFLTSLGKDRMILGYPFLREFNPRVNWTEGKLEGGSVELQSTKFKHLQRVFKRANETLRQTGRLPTKVVAFLRRTNLAQEWSRIEERNRTHLTMETIPKEFRRHWRVFSEELSKRFPPKRNPDMTIKLLPDAPTSIKCKPYPQSKAEGNGEEAWIKQELALGRIKEGPSPYVSPIFFIGKKDSGEKRVIIDYRRINAWMVKDHNPIPGIRQAMEKLQGKTLFSKFDIRHGYNNIRLAEEDKHKAAIQTRHGTYIPQVMYYGTSNAPAFFQRTMRRDFASFLEQYKDNADQYMDDYWIATTDDEEGVALHIEAIHAFLGNCEKHSYFLKASKCEIMKKQITLLGWLVTGEGLRIDPTKVTGISEWPRTLESVKQVRKTMGVLGYQRPFIQGFAKIAKPIVELTKKGMPFEWTEERRDALETLIQKVTSAPVLAFPDLERPFELEVDASAYAVGAILFQRDEQDRKRDVGYFSKALKPAEWNYDIWDREFLAVIKALGNWRHILIGTPHKITVWTDHANLQYYRQPQKVNRRVARGINFMAEFPLELKHIAVRKNRADPLSRRPDYDDGSKDNEEVVALPDKLFVRTIQTSGFDHMITDLQWQQAQKMAEWKKEYHLRRTKEGRFHKGIAMVVPINEKLRKDLVELMHDSPTAAHPGVDKTHKALLRQYWWPGCKEFVQQYVKGCAICQANKPITHRNNPPLNPIMPQEGALPFQTIAIDFIVKLPTSDGYDSIMTVTDHDCTKAVILVPCKETIDAEGVAKLFKDRIFPFVGLPKRIISDRDPRFRSTFFKELCKQLEVTQNLSTAYHPQTDGQSEKTNKHVELALRIYCNYQQDNWAQWLPMVQYAINTRPSTTTKQAPYELWMGFIPRAHQPEQTSEVPAIEHQKEQLKEARKQALEAMKRAQELLGRTSKHKPYRKGQKVWLEGTNLQTTHPTAKLRPKRYGPFVVTEKIGQTTYRLELPAHWKIHNAFHASLLLPYHETKEHGRNFLEPAPELIEGQPEWEVEEVLDSRRHRRKLQYLIKWKGYSNAHNSWEPKENVNVPELLKAFLRRHPQAIRTIKPEKDNSAYKRLALLVQKAKKCPKQTSLHHVQQNKDRASKTKRHPLTQKIVSTYQRWQTGAEKGSEPKGKNCTKNARTDKSEETCECSICKRKATKRTAEEPMAKTPPMKIRSVKIIQGELETLLAETTNSRAQRRTRTAKSTQNPATARILKQIKGDCVPGAGSLKSKDCIRNPKTPPRSRRQTMLIRSIRIDEEEPRMSSGRTPPPPDHSEDVLPAPGTITFSPALENAFQAVRTHRHRHRPEVTVESLRRTSFALSPATATSAIVASGSFVAHPRLFADVAASISPSATL